MGSKPKVWVEDDGLVTRRGYGYWAFHEEREFTEENWTDAELVTLERAATMLEQWLNDNWPRGGPSR
jgi:hypothetical protein